MNKTQVHHAKIMVQMTAMKEVHNKTMKTNHILRFRDY